jgi:phospholipid/cholesterol/gamma-HCH transport system permease protein
MGLLNDILFIIGDYVQLIYRACSRPEKASMYWRETFRQAAQIGIGSLPIIAVVGTFIGAVSGVQYAYQMRNMAFVPIWWVGSVERKSLILELGPTITALLLAGKVGSNIASELGTMRITDQIDAYELMGVNTPAYLIGPKILAAITMGPLLSVISVVLGIIGGWFSGIMDKYYTSGEYFRGVTDGFHAYDVWVMTIKSLLFGFILTSVSGYMGYTVKGGAVQLGRNSTQAVVISSIAIVVVDFFVAYLML